MRLIDVLKENAPLVVVSIFALMIYLANAITLDVGHTTHDITAFHHDEVPAEDVPQDFVAPIDEEVPVPIRTFETPETQMQEAPQVIPPQQSPPIQQQQASNATPGAGHETLEDIDIEHYHSSAAYMERLSEFLDSDYKEFVEERVDGGGFGGAALIQWVPTSAMVTTVQQRSEREVPVYRLPRSKNELSWEFLSSSQMTNVIRRHEQQLQGLYNALDPKQFQRSREQLSEYVAGIRALLAYKKPDLSPRGVAFLLEEMDMQVSRKLRVDGISRAQYASWVEIDLTPLIGSSYTLRYKQQLTPPFQLRMRLISCKFLRPPGNVRGVNPNILRVNFTFAVSGGAFKEFYAINSQGNRRARGAIQNERRGYREIAFTNLNVRSYDMLVRATDGSEQKIRYDFSGYKGTEGYRPIEGNNWLAHTISPNQAEQRFRRGEVR